MSQQMEQWVDKVIDVYSGPECTLWKLIMGEQIHIGGFKSSMMLAEMAGIGPGMSGVDLCCCLGAGMRFLRRFRQVDAMTGVDATAAVLTSGAKMNEEEGQTGITFIEADATNSTLPASGTDFVWGEDAWCYVDDKEALVNEAARIVKAGGTIAFTDWIEGANPMSEEERARFCGFMKFPNVQTIEGYTALLENAGCTVEVAEDTEQFLPHVNLYLQMLDMQLTYDALKIIGFDTEMMGGMAGEMQFMQGLAEEGKIIQGRFIAKKA